MNLHALRLFYQVADKGSVTLASEALNISQPAVTSQIKKLERELDLKLWTSSGRGVVLTEAGKRLAAEANRLFAMEAEIEDTLQQLKSGAAGKLHIVATYLPANFLLPKWIAHYKQKHPNVEIELTTTNSSQAIDSLIHFKSDLALIGGIREDHPLLERTEWLEDDMCFVVHKQHRLAGARIHLAEMVNEPFIFREEGSFSRDQLIALCTTHNLPIPAVGLQMNGLNETLRVVMEGYGAAFLSSLETEDYVARGEIQKVHVQGIHLKNPISLYTRKELPSPPTSQFMHILMQDKN
ncbi:LysR family transcriptional regulator [Paenibacillus pini]|uniref:Transcriptional regulator n=1 Tax=Paenibacillus pini JCM 16418 TaxID=1236976 RepID=W7YC48_9BACL|nr:transcriptional regulator [Paenibacillus pini JCM 16418]